MSRTKDYLQPLARKAKRLARCLLIKDPEAPLTLDFPHTQGVYLVYRKRAGSIIYVGKGKDLRRRIRSDHISGEQKITTSSFRKGVHEKYRIEPGKEMREWVINKCLFAYEEIQDADICNLVEALLIASMRARGEPLLNK